MFSKIMLVGLLSSTVLITGCVSAPPERAEYAGLSQRESGWSRIYVSAGKMEGVGAELRSVQQVGPVFIDNRRVGSTAKGEHFIVDLMPGTYEVYCMPEQPEKNFVEKSQFTFKAGEIRYFACDMKSMNVTSSTVGSMFGALGAAIAYSASEYVSKTYLAERPMDDPKSKLVSYKKLQ